MRRWVALVLLLATTLVRAETLAGVVVVVIDGDTVLFRPDTYHPASRAFLRVRLAGIDAPEAAQPHGEAATHALGKMVLQQPAKLEIIGVDRYGRKLGYLVVGATAVNAALVQRGHAWAYLRYAPDTLHAMQAQARAARLGLWQDRHPQAPWAWRRQHAPLAEAHPLATGASRPTSPPAP